MRTLILASVFALASVPFAHAATEHLTAKLSAETEVPAKDGKGTGTADVTLDTATHQISYVITYAGLTGQATAAHFHGPAAPGANAGVLVPIAAPLESPIKGTATLTEAQQADLLAGKTYVNVHTEANKGGEIRGQVELAK